MPVTFDEFLEKCREVDGWRLNNFGYVVNANKECPLQAVFGTRGYSSAGRDEGLEVDDIIAAADNFRYADKKLRKALLGLVKP